MSRFPYARRPMRLSDGPAPQRVLTAPNPPEDGAFNPRAGNKDFFWFSTPKVAIAAAATASTTVILDADADFYCVAMTYMADIAAATLTYDTFVLPLVTVLITDSGSGYALSNNPIPIPSLMGNGFNPYRLIRPRVFAAQAQIQFSLNNFSAATTYNISLIMHGYKVRLGG